MNLRKKCARRRDKTQGWKNRKKNDVLSFSKMKINAKMNKKKLNIKEEREISG